MQEEIWLPIKGYEGYYEVSNLSRVRSLERTTIHKNGKVRKHGGLVLRMNVSTNRYKCCMLSVNGKVQRKVLHRLVAIAFIPNPENKPFVNHIDGDKTNNDISNLEWCTCSENTIHAFKIGLRHTHKNLGEGGKRKGIQKRKTILQYDMNNNFIKEWKGIKLAGDTLGIKFTNISMSCNNKPFSRSAGGYKWVFKTE